MKKLVLAMVLVVVVVVGGIGLYRATRQGVGETCSADGDCRSGLCMVVDHGVSNCLEPCATDAECPADHECVGRHEPGRRVEACHRRIPPLNLDNLKKR